MTHKSQIPEEDLRAAEEAVRIHDTKQAAAEALGITISALGHRLRQAKKRRLQDKAKQLELPIFPDSDIPTEELLTHMEKRFEARRKSLDAETWFTVKIKEELPIGIMWFGDPHIDDNGCDIKQLRYDCQLCAESEGLYGANIGDSTNNWAGRLMRLYADQDTSLKTAQRLVEWFMLESGVSWLLWLAGNHDQMSGYATLRQMGKRFKPHNITLHDWEARFKLKFPNNKEFKIFAAHDFKGSSIYNLLHGPLREGLMGEDADLYICGHKHNAALMSLENPAKGHWQHFLRVRGYKFLDSHARRWGYKEQRHGCSAVTVFDPYDQSIRVFQSTAEGADFLNYIREKRKNEGFKTQS